MSIDVETRKDIKRLCDIILDNITNVGAEAESLALHIGHHPDILNIKEDEEEKDNDSVRPWSNF